MVACTCVALALAIFAAAVSMVIASFGHGALIVLRSFITSLLPVHRVARVYRDTTTVDSLEADVRLCSAGGYVKVQAVMESMVDWSTILLF